MLAGVAGAADDERHAVARGSARTPCTRGRRAGRARRAARPSRGPWTASTACSRCWSTTVTPVGRGRRRMRTTSGGVRRVRDEEDVVVDREVGDEVVDDAAGLVAQQRVLRLAGRDAPEGVGEHGVEERGRAGAGDRRLAEVRDVEDADPLAHRGVLGDDAAAGVLERHRPAAEVAQLGAERQVPVVQRGQQCLGRVAHGREPTGSRRTRGPATTVLRASGGAAARRTGTSGRGRWPGGRFLSGPSPGRRPPTDPSAEPAPVEETSVTTLALSSADLTIPADRRARRGDRARRRPQEGRRPRRPRGRR